MLYQHPLAKSSSVFMCDITKMTKTKTAPEHEPLLALISLNYWALENRMLQRCKVLLTKDNTLTGKDKGGYRHLGASYAIRHSKVYHVALTSENITTFALENEGIRYSDLWSAESVVRLSVSWYRMCDNFFNIQGVRKRLYPLFIFFF
jgi:hypothetical protein